jgi:hypothetical protein
MPLATTWNVPPAGPPPNIILSLANALPENAKVITKITTRMVKNLFLMVTLLNVLMGQYFGIIQTNSLARMIRYFSVFCHLMNQAFL